MSANSIPKRKDPVREAFLEMIPIDEVTSLSELWKSKEWKKRSREYVDGKPCSWCGAVNGDTYMTTSGKTRKLGLSPHHIEKHKWGLPLYNQVKNRIANHWYKMNRHSHGYEVPTGLSQRETKEYLKNQYINDNIDFIKQQFEETKQIILKQYIDLKQEYIIVLCTRCHFAREKGLVLCKECKKGYHKPKFERCWTCSKNVHSCKFQAEKPDPNTLDENT